MWALARSRIHWEERHLLVRYSEACLANTRPTNIISLLLLFVFSPHVSKNPIWSLLQFVFLPEERLILTAVIHLQDVRHRSSWMPEIIWKAPLKLFLSGLLKGLSPVWIPAEAPRHHTSDDGETDIQGGVDWGSTPMLGLWGELYRTGV